MLLAQLPSRVPHGAELSLLVRIGIRRDAVPDSAAAPLRLLEVGPAGADVSVIVQASRGLVAQGPLEQVIHTPATGDSEPVRFPFFAREPGLQRVRVTAWAGGTFLAELALEVSVSVDSPYVDAPPKAAPVSSLQAEPGEVTLLVRYDGQRYTFQLLSDSYLFEPVLAESLTAEPSLAVEQAIATLHKMATGGSGYAGPNARLWIKQTGIGLWNDMVPEAIREQFWTLRSSIRSFSIATGRDTIPWEMLYPLSPSHDEGFLIEQFPVLRRVYDQRRNKSINMGNPRFVVPADSPANVKQEIATIRRVLRDDGAAPVIIEDLDVLVDLIASGDLGLAHFACHNTYRADAGGSSIQMGGGAFVPALLNSAVALGSLAAHRPLVFINACRSAGATPQYTRVMGWAEQFMKAGAARSSALCGRYAATGPQCSPRPSTMPSTLASHSEKPRGRAGLPRARTAPIRPGWPTPSTAIRRHTR